MAEASETIFAAGQDQSDAPAAGDAAGGAADANYKASDKASADVNELLAQDNEDESLRRYKESLLGAAAQGDVGDSADPRRVIGLEFRVAFEDPSTPEQVLDMTAAGDKQSFSMIEGCNYKFKLAFRVQHQIVNGLKFVNKVSKAVFSDTTELMLGSYAPQSAPHLFEIPKHGWEQAPKGMMMRGKFSGKCKFVDSDGNEHATFAYKFEITKKK